MFADLPKIFCIYIGLLMIGAVTSTHAEWKPVAGNIMTPWAAKVSPAAPLPEYPRPQMVRKNWINLNGLWDYAVTSKDAARPGQFEGQILVPFCIESALSGVKKSFSEKDRLWYRRNFTVPGLKGESRLLLHFGAVDCDATVSVNGKVVGTHHGGYGSFTFDITDSVKKEVANELEVTVTDPSSRGKQAFGKQVLGRFEKPEGTRYTTCSGIWQTVWLEVVPRNYIKSLKIEPDVDAEAVRITVKGGAKDASVEVLDGGKTIAQAEGKTGEPVTLKIPGVKLWSPDSPFLYDLKITSGKDEVKSYFGMRKIAIGKDAQGIMRPLLNGQYIFQCGPLDQGYWPDGIYTAPTDEALKYDLEMLKKFGFNMVRKHIKVEPARWYYWCDKLGVMVWQDMPAGNVGKRIGGTGLAPVQAAVSPEAAQAFEGELKEMVLEHFNNPSIIVWVIFNESWGQYDTSRLGKMVRGLDSSRLIDEASGGIDFKTGDMVDVHCYPGPVMAPLDGKRISVLGEFGGLGLRVSGHLWYDGKTSSYQEAPDAFILAGNYQRVWHKVGELEKKGLSAAVYTQMTDVECEINGLLTYDRKVVKLDPNQVSAAGFIHGKFPPLPVYANIMESSESKAVKWKYTTSAPAGDWFKPGYDDSAWGEGEGGFGTIDNNGAKSRTPWTTSDIWLRREFEIPEGKQVRPVFWMFHDEDTEIYLNGILASQTSGYTTNYAVFPVSSEAAASLKPGKNLITVHCLQTRGKQYIDVGIQDMANNTKK